MPSTTDEWVEVRITSDLDAGELLGALGDPHTQGAWQDGNVIRLYWPRERWTSDHAVQLRQLLNRMTPGRCNEADIQVQPVANQDWNRLWAQSVKPLRIGKRIVIRPSWETVAVRPDQIEIVLDPKQAFGTGHHATTRMVLEWLEEIIRGGETVLDVGTGSGVLAMAALRLGAASAVGLDNDPVAIECAREYAALNRFGTELSLQCATLCGEGSFDLVLANLDRQTLLGLADKLAGYTGRLVLVSGLMLDQRQEIVDAFAAVGLYAGEEREQDGWLAMAFTPAQSCEGG